MLEGFTRINKDNEAMFNQLANQKASVPNDDLSPYQEGRMKEWSPVAQMEELRTVNARVPGSSPGWGVF